MEPVGKLKVAEHRFWPRTDPHPFLPVEPEHLSAAEVIVFRHSAFWPHVAPGLHEEHTVEAEVDRGRWVVHCPWCPSAQLASDKDRRFFCVEGCNLQNAGGQFITVVWPENRHEIESQLLLRPPLARYWKPGESTLDLAAENVLHGLPIAEMPDSKLITSGVTVVPALSSPSSTAELEQ